MAQEIDPFKLSSPRIFLVRMVVFLTLCALVVVVLYKQIWTAFLANAVLNALIIGVLLIGIALAFRQVIRLFPEIDWVNGFRLADPGLAVERPPVLLAPMAVLLRDRVGRMAISAQVMRGILDSIAARLDEARDTSRYMTALLGGIGIAFSASLFGLAGSLVLGFLDLQTSQAQNRFYTELEDWLSTTVHDLGVGGDAAAPVSGAVSSDLRVAIERLREAITDGGSSRATTTAMANLAEAIQGLVHHMRSEQQMIRDWVDSQAQQHREVRRLLEILVRENVNK